MSPSERKAMIRKDHTDLSLTRQCKLLKISRSSLYYTPVGIDAETLKLMNEIDRVFTKYPFFGSRQIAAYRNREVVLRLIEQAKAGGAAIIGIFHDEAARARVCDREIDVTGYATAHAA